MKLSFLLLLLAFIGLVSTAPVQNSNAYEKEAKAFWGAFLNATSNGESEKIRNLLYDKFLHFLEGMFSAEQEAELKKAHAVEMANESYSNAPALLASVKQRSEEKFDSLKPESKQFFKNVSEVSLPTSFESKAVVAFFDQYHAKFNSLSDETKRDIISTFPVMGRLDELSAYLHTLDAILSGMNTICDNTTGLALCTTMRKFTHRQ